MMSQPTRCATSGSSTLVLDHVGQRRLDDFARVVRLLSRPIPERRPEAMRHGGDLGTGTSSAASTWLSACRSASGTPADCRRRAPAPQRGPPAPGRRAGPGALASPSSARPTGKPIGYSGNDSTNTAKHPPYSLGFLSGRARYAHAFTHARWPPTAGGRCHRGAGGRAGRAGHARTERPPLRHQPPNQPDSPTHSSSAPTKAATGPSVQSLKYASQ